MLRFHQLIIFGVLACQCFAAYSLNRESIPEPLIPWIDWVLKDEPDLDCPFNYQDYAVKHCQWPGRLTLSIQRESGTFSSRGSIFKSGWITLPGNDDFWPVDVTLNDKAVVIIKHNGKPAVKADAGSYQINGRFSWKNQPLELAIPEHTGILELSVDGQHIEFPVIKQGRVWLQDNKNQQSGLDNVQNRYDLQVFRKVIDDVPLQLHTWLQLEVSGQQRELLLPQALLKPFIPISLTSMLPAKLENDGSLRVQVKPGRWQIQLTARHPDPLQELSLNIDDRHWPEYEIWAFQAMPQLRLVEIDNLISIDPNQTNLPQAWRTLPAYRLKQGDSMKFKVIRRGDAQPEPNQLTLRRKLWLDFNGAGYTVEDNISGKMTSDWRLNALPETEIGQVELNGEKQLITQQEQSDARGIEVRKGQLQVTADSRINQPINHISAVGWQQDFTQVNAELNLPPGWRLLAATGVDNVPDSWISRWTLLDLFLVLITSFAIGRLWNIYWGGLALITLALTWHEVEAPRFIWLFILIAVSLIRVLPQGRFLQLMHWYRNICWLVLVLIVIPFLIMQARIALYPQLEKTAPITPATHISTAGDQTMATVALQEEFAKAPPASLRTSRYQDYAQKPPVKDIERFDPDANIQTGPGLPQWQWRQIRLSWNGRVAQEQQVQLWYLSPPISRLLNIARIILVCALSLLMFGVLQRNGKFVMPSVNLVLCLVLLGLPTAQSRADFPDEKMLQALKQQVLKAPDCLPQCAQIASLHINIAEQTMELQLDYHVQQDSAVILPAQTSQWLPAAVNVDGKLSQQLLRQQDHLWLMLTRGIHSVVMRGTVPASQQFTLALPMPPHHITVNSPGWRVDGIHENGKIDDQLQLTRLPSATKQTALPTLQQSALPAFVRIERMLRLGLDWRIETRVSHLSASNSAAILAVPLLSGETITSSHVQVKDNRVLVNLPAGQQSIAWQSALAKSDKITLLAAENNEWTEVWTADVSPIWHFTMDGISVIHHQDQQGRWLPEWRPWPGEQVVLHITRPQAVPGKTLTIDRTELTVTPGKRAQQANLALSLRSSKGGQHSITLPEGAILQSVAIDGITQPIRQQGNTVPFPINPGAQNITLNWHENVAEKIKLTTADINLGMASVNSHIKVVMGHDRWVLFIWGPQFGPAALIWGIIIILALLAFALSKIKTTPLKFWQWLLLLIGLSQLSVAAGMVVVAWLLALGFRSNATMLSDKYFNAAQMMIGILTALAMVVLIVAVQQGLLGAPDMQISGNHSSAYQLNWYQDSSPDQLPTATVISVPLLVYRVLMLIWALWLAASVLNWLKWGWQCFSRDGLWHKKIKPEPTK